ncbi:MAG: hypothetical protein AAGC63_09990 [Propionicimonas sp.]|nr:hypothetical protein [Propionicimonas sp.]
MAGPQLILTGVRRYTVRVRLGSTPAMAAVDSARECLDGRNLAGALRLGYTLLREPATADAGHAVLGLAHASSSSPALAWAEFSRIGDPEVIAAFGNDYFPAGFRVDPVATSAVARRLLDHVGWPELPASVSVTIAQHAFSVGSDEVARRYLAAAEEGRLGPTAAIGDQFGRLASWLPGGEHRAPVPDLPADLRFGVLDHRQPAHRSRNVGDYIQSLAGLGLLVRRRDLTFVGDDELTGLAGELAAKVKRGRELAGPRRVVHLVGLEREATSYQDLPGPIWAVMAGWYSHPTFSGGWGVPFHPAIRPILVSFHIASAASLTAEAIDYLRRYGPVGGRDWQTVALLRAAGVPSFFSGCVSMTVDTLFPDADQSARVRTAFVDPHKLTRDDAKGDVIEQDGHDLRSDPLPVNLRRAHDWVERFHSVYADVVTTRLHSYLPARAVGCAVRFEPANPSDVCYGGLLDLDDLQFDALRSGLLDKTGAVLQLLLDGADEDAVYARWRELCAPDVAEAERFLDSFELPEHPLPEPSVPVPLSSRLVLIDAPYRSEKGVRRLLESLAEHAPGLPVVLVGAAGEHADVDRWIRDLPVPERGSAQQQQALLVASVLNSLPSGVRALLLPSDAVVRGPLEGLFEVDLAGAAVAAGDELRRGRQDLSTMLRRIATRQARGWQDALALLAASQARCGHGATAFDPRVSVVDPDALRAAGFATLARPLIEDFGASLGETLNIVLRGRRAALGPGDHGNVALETPAAGATVISGLSQARMGAHWFA